MLDFPEEVEELLESPHLGGGPHPHGSPELEEEDLPLLPLPEPLLPDLPDDEEESSQP